MKKFLSFLHLFLIIILTSCEYEVIPELMSIEFTSDRTIEYHYTTGDTAFSALQANLKSITDSDGKKCNIHATEYETQGFTGRIKLSDNVPDGATVVIDFEDSDGNYLYTVTIIK